MESDFTNAFFSNSPTIPAGYTCSCGKLVDHDQSFGVECYLNYVDGGEENVNVQRMKYRLGQDGAYELVESSWGDTYYGTLNARETLFISNGAVTGCAAAGCSPCAVCDDEASIAVDCSSLGDELGYTRVCADPCKDRDEVSCRIDLRPLPLRTGLIARTLTPTVIKPDADAGALIPGKTPFAKSSGVSFRPNFSWVASASAWLVMRVLA